MGLMSYEYFSNNKIMSLLNNADPQNQADHIEFIILTLILMIAKVLLD